MNAPRFKQKLCYRPPAPVPSPSPVSSSSSSSSLSSSRNYMIQVNTPRTLHVVGQVCGWHLWRAPAGHQGTPAPNVSNVGVSQCQNPPMTGNGLYNLFISIFADSGDGWDDCCPYLDFGVPYVGLGGPPGDVASMIIINIINSWHELGNMMEHKSWAYDNFEHQEE